MSRSREQKQHPFRSRPKAPLSQKLAENLKDYAVAASAAGVGAMMLSASAGATIAYTPANTNVGGPTAIDLNHDGIADFSIQEFCCGQHYVVLAVKPEVFGNQIRPTATGFYAACGFFGVPVGPGEKFTPGTSYLGLWMANAGSYGGASSWFLGPWANATNRYLGFKFLINGKVHYGWARLTVKNFNQGGAVTITGYAYETTPQTALKEGILSGPTKESAEMLAPVEDRAGLGALALGTSGLAIWRREEELSPA
ncbi:MAG TPA: hypothetical protein VMH04_17135 [Candidatus Solibacter sp.]|nr:hypothetical protein [Candidatus Solibacter sp.]